MADGTAIEWTDATWNPIRARGVAGKTGWHCEKVSDGCRNCYAEGINRRLGNGLEYKPGYRDALEIFLDEKTLLAPLKWKRPRCIFVCSMTDLFADFVKDEWIDRMFAVMALASQHRFQVLTKRAKRMRKYCSGHPLGCWVNAVGTIAIGHFGTLAGKFANPLPNVWLGVSAEDQANADARVPDLLATPAAVRFVSLEPLLGPITLWQWNEDAGALRGPGVVISRGRTAGSADFPPEGYDDSYPGLDWVICGGESGPHARPMHPAWARSLRDQCKAGCVPFFFKQWGTWHSDAMLFTDTEGRCPPPNMKIGKARAGRLLDGELHDGMPA